MRVSFLLHARYRLASEYSRAPASYIDMSETTKDVKKNRAHHLTVHCRRQREGERQASIFSTKVKRFDLSVNAHLMDLRTHALTMCFCVDI